MLEDIEKTVNDINEHCPIQIDQTTRLDKCEALPNNTFRFDFTFLFIDATKIDAVEFGTQMRDILLYNIQCNPQMKLLIENHATFIYYCVDENKNSLDTITITPQDYAKPAKKPALFDPTTITSDNLQKVLQDMVKKTKKQLPLFTEESGINMIDCSTYNKTLEYTCKLLNEDVARFDSIYFKTTAIPAAVQSLKNNPDMKYFAEQGVSIRNIYLDKHNKYLCAIDISPEDYK